MLAYKFRLYPNKEEEGKLLRTLEICRLTYNRFLELHRDGEHDRGKLQVDWMKQEASTERAGWFTL